MSRRYSVSLIKDLLAKTKEYEDRIAHVENSVQECRKRISERAQKAQITQSYKELDAIPVEELRREAGNGVRIKPLKENGFHTVADVYSARVYQLSSIGGISEQGAQELKKAAKKYADRVAQTARIRISADDRTAEMTNLLFPVYQYKNFRLELDKLAHLHQQDH